MRNLAILPAIAALVPACASPPAGGTASVYAIVDRSEWAPPGYIQLDLVTGHYQLKPQPPRGGSPADVWMRRGTLSADRLATLRHAHGAARAEGLTVPACRDGGRPETVIVSNAGPISMTLSGRGSPLATHEERGCWSEAAWRLYRLLEELF